MLLRHDPPIEPEMVFAKMPPMDLAERFIETQTVPSVVKGLLANGGLELIINRGHVIITNSRTGVGAVLHGHSKLSNTLERMEDYAQC